MCNCVHTKTLRCFVCVAANYSFWYQGLLLVCAYAKPYGCFVPTAKKQPNKAGFCLSASWYPSQSKGLLLAVFAVYLPSVLVPRSKTLPGLFTHPKLFLLRNALCLAKQPFLSCVPCLFWVPKHSSRKDTVAMYCSLSVVVY
jgi:hypothetical protein